MVVSSVTPMRSVRHAREALRVAGEARAERVEDDAVLRALSVRAAASGTAPAFSNSTPLCTSRVASPPSSRIRFGPSKPSADQSKMRSARRQYSSSVSPFHANTGTPAGASTVPVGPTTTAAAASSCVEKMLQLAQRTCAPSATSVSMSTAVCTVMCSDPAMRAPGERLRRAELLAQRHEARHLVLGEAQLVASGFGEREVGDLELERTVDGVGDAGSDGIGDQACGSASAHSATASASDAQRLVPHDDPALGHRQPVGVDRAEVVRVRIAAGAERTERRHLVAVVVGERRHGLAGAADLGAESLAHRVDASVHR